MSTAMIPVELPPGTRVRFRRYGRPFIGRVVQDDPLGFRAKIRVETEGGTRVGALSMTTQWISYGCVTEVLST